MRFFLKIVRGLARRGWRLRAGCPKKRIEEVMVIRDVGLGAVVVG